VSKDFGAGRVKPKAQSAKLKKKLQGPHSKVGWHLVFAPEPIAQLLDDLGRGQIEQRGLGLDGGLPQRLLGLGSLEVFLSFEL